MTRLLLLICLSAAILTGCKQDPYVIDQGQESVMDFDWEATQKVKLDVVSENQGIVPFFVYNGTEMLFSGFTPFKGNIIVPKSCKQLTLANSFIETKETKAWEWSGGTVTVDCGSGIQVTVPKLLDHHEYLYTQWAAQSAIGVTWSAYVSWWNAAGFTAQSSIRLYADRGPEMRNGKLYIYHTCLWPQCEENHTEEETTSFTTVGTYMFEDLFPSMGDYDMNDFVVVEEVTRTVSTQNKVLSAELLYQINASGVSGTTAIAMAINLLSIPTSGIESVKLFRVDESGVETPYECNNVSGAFSLDANGVEKPTSSTTVIPLFDNFRTLMPYVGQCFNTVNTPNGGKGAPLKLKVKLLFKAGFEVVSTDFKTDVFIMPRMGNSPISEQRGVEIHTADAPYTLQMNTALFGTGKDCSNLIPGKTFRTKEGYVWAMYLPINNFRHPLEYISIKNAYPDFEKWVLSNGTESTDWYNHPSEGKVWSW